MSTRIFGIEGATPRVSKEAICLRCYRVVGIGNRKQILELLMHHFGRVHGGVPDMLIESPDQDSPGDFTTHPAPFRCDICGDLVEPPWWTLVTPPAPGYGVEDPAWLVCDPCHALVVERDVMGLVRRYMDVATRTYSINRPEARELGLELIPNFLSHVDLSQSERHARYDP